MRESTPTGLGAPTTRPKRPKRWTLERHPKPLRFPCSLVNCAPVRVLLGAPHIMLSWSFAASDIMEGFHGGSHTTSTAALVTPATERTFASTSGGREPA